MTKYMTEVVIRDVCKAYPDWGAMLLRYFNPAGSHLGADIGEEPQGTPNNLMPYVAQVAVGARPKLFVFGGDYDTPDGTPIRCIDTARRGDNSFTNQMSLTEITATSWTLPRDTFTV